MIYLPTAVREQALSSWAGRPDGLRIDPIGVEAVPRIRGAGRRSYVHVLTHQDLSPTRIRSWQVRQILQHLVRLGSPSAEGDDLNRLVDARAEQHAGREWLPATITIDGRSQPALSWTVTPTLWAVYAEQGEDRIAVIAKDVPAGALELRTASTQEARELRTEALRV